MRRILATFLLGWVLVLTFASPALPSSTDDGFGQFDCPATIDGDPVVCDDTTSTGIPGGFVALFVLVAIGGVVITVYKVSMARDMATKSGMDPDQATAMTLLDDNGLSATYLASNLRPQTGGPTLSGDAPGERTAAERLEEIDGLLRQQLITQAEYDERRAAILGSL